MNRKIKIAVLVSGSGTNLEALLRAQLNGVIASGSIEAVISSNAEAYALVRAKDYGIKSFTVARKEHKDKQSFEAAILDILAELDIELIVLAGFMHVLSADFIRKYEHRIINIHPSLIPAFCGDGFYGLKVHEAALARGVLLTGATVHYVNEVTDGGEIIMQKTVKVRKDDTPIVLQRRVMEQAEWIMLPQACEKVCKQLLKEG